MAIARILPDPYEVAPYVAAAAFSEGVAVIVGSDDKTCALAGAAPTTGLLGVTRTSCASGDVVDVVMGGIARVKAGAAITRGVLVTTDSSGRATTATIGSGSNVLILGMALESCTAANDYIAVKINVVPMPGA